MAVTAALVFAGQMINYTIPGTGSSGHMCGGMLLSALLGPQAGFLSMIVILAIQCLFFADGGLMALGANVWNMAFYGCFVGYYLIWRPILRAGWFSRMGEKAGQRARIIWPASSAAWSRCSWARSPWCLRPACPASPSCPSARSWR